MKTVKTHTRARIDSFFMIQPSAFTLVELLVVIGIIVILVAVLIPVVGRVKTSAQNVQTQAAIKDISAAIELYNNDFRAYPGPLKNDEIWNESFNGATFPLVISATDAASITAENYETADPYLRKHITMSENLVLGLMGGLRIDAASPAPSIVYDPRLVGRGANSLTGLPKHYSPYMSDQKYLSWRTVAGKKTGHFVDELDPNGAKDTIIPEFVDAYPDPLPLLYMRAKKGASVDPNTPALSNTNNVVATYEDPETFPVVRRGQYDLHQISGYTTASIGTGRKPPTYVGWPNPLPTHGLTTADPSYTLNSNPAKDHYPMDGYVYLRNRSLSSPPETDTTSTLNYATGTTASRNDVPVQKDGYILISAGPDRIYGTKDDITNFGAVGQ